MPKLTPAQRFQNIFKQWTSGATVHVRTTAEKKMDEWLARNGKTRSDISALVAEAVADDLKANPPPPPSDPRDGAPHPFDNPRFTPAGLVEGIIAKYVAMSEHVRVIYVLWIIFTHVYTKFSVAPRIALTSEDPDSGKTTTLEVARRLVLRPNPETLGTGAAIEDFLNQGPCTVLLDELDHVDAEARRRLQQVWNMGHKRGAQIASMRAGRRKLLDIHAPVLAAGVGSFLAPTQRSRTFTLEMRPYDEVTKPEREFNDDDVEDLNVVYSYLRKWSAEVKLSAKPEMPPGVIRRSADNARGLLSIADACGPEWGRRARAAVTWLLEKEKAERPEVLILHHALMIMDMLELDVIRSRVLNRELHRLDEPDARWDRHRGASGSDYTHALRPNEQAALLRMSGIKAQSIRPPGGGKAIRGYRREWFVEALRVRGEKPPAPRLRLVPPEAE
jgi:Protein of unknown function (DUF3631)